MKRAVIICGGRAFAESFHAHKRIVLQTKGLRALDAFAASKGIDYVIQGGAKGADALGKRWASIRGVTSEEILADWDHLGRAAGMIRNGVMLSHLQVLGDTGFKICLLAFPGGKGTTGMKGLAHKAGVQVYVCDESQWTIEKGGL